MQITQFSQIPEGQTIIYYGGSFNPPHISHILFAMTLRSLLPGARLIVAPTYSHAFNKGLLPFDLRVDMLRAELGSIPGIEISTIERDLHESTSYTIDVVKALKAANPQAHILVAVGADIVPTLPKWRSIDELNKLCDFLVFPRAGYEAESLPIPALPEISSSCLRERIGIRTDENDEFLRAHIPQRILTMWKDFLAKE